MYEVEVKVAADHDDVRAALPDDAERLGAVEQVDTYFDAPHRDFAATDEALRLRRERDLPGAGDRAAGSEGDAEDDGVPAGGAAGESDAPSGSSWATLLTYKGPLVEAESKTREEFESALGDGEAVRAALERLGFEPAAEVRKERERFAVGEFTVTLDAVADLGEFVEVETEREEGEVAAARDAARELLADLGCDPEEQIRTSYLGLLLDAGD